MTEPLLAPETPDLVWFRGQDAVRFLDDIVSQEVADAKPGQVLRSLLLAPQGKLEHILWVLRGEGEVGLVTDPGRGDHLAAYLGRYRIRVDVQIEAETEPLHMIVGAIADRPGQWSKEDGRVSADISWSTLSRTLRTGVEPELARMSVEDYETARISAGEPRFGVDVDESTIPHESGLVPETVDFTKGCFLGQELVARIDSRGGNVPRRLHLLDLGDSAAAAGDPVFHDGSAVGSVTSRSGSVALAMLKRDVGPGDEVTVGDSNVVLRPSRL